jgi:hypothetical protein
MAPFDSRLGAIRVAIYMSKGKYFLLRYFLSHPPIVANLAKSQQKGTPDPMRNRVKLGKVKGETNMIGHREMQNRQRTAPQ